MTNAYAVGERIYLRHPTGADAEGRWHEWLSDEDTTRWFTLQHWPNSVEGQREFYESTRKSRDRLVLSIVDKENDTHIGVCNLSSINWVHRFCDVALLIGESKYRTGPYAIETMSLLLRVAFLRLNLRLVKSSFVEGNEASRTIHDVFRFKAAGRIEQAFWDRGRYVDMLIATLARGDWMTRNGMPPAAGDEA